MGVFGSSGQLHRHIKKLRWLFRYPRSEPYFMTWLVPHQIKLTSGRRSKQLTWAFSGQVVSFIGTSKNSGGCFGIQGLSPIS